MTCLKQKNVKYVNCRKIKKARPLIFSISTYKIHVSIHTKKQLPGFLHFSIIDTFHILLFETCYLTIQLKKLNEARELIFCMNA